MPTPGPRRLWRWGIAAAVVALIAGGAAAFILLHSPGNVSHPNLSFTAPTTTTSTTTAKKPVKRVPPAEWLRYGFDAGRTRAFTASRTLAPPFHVGWRYNDNALLEFPPVLYGNTLFFLDDNGVAKAIDKRNGHQIWARKVGTLAAASPAVGVGQHLIFMPLLSTNPNAGQNPGNGRFVALSMGGGHVVWSRPIPAGSESSPIVYGDTVYFGDQSGTVHALSASTGHTIWTYHASGPVKGGPAIVGGIVYFGDYDGKAYAVDARTGHQVWAVTTEGAHFGFGSGNFYATPAVAFGRVYMGNTDGRVYSFAARTGQLAWATSTSAYVYSSAAVADLPGIGPTVYVGSYDGNMYAFDARSGSVRWKHSAGGKISGAGTIVNGVLYFSDLGNRDTEGLDVRTGHRLWTFPDGAFNPVIADSTTIYLDGYGAMYQLVPRVATHAAARAPSHAKHAARKVTRKAKKRR
jgi:outer membrane protein assembly factor BamB